MEIMAHFFRPCLQMCKEKVFSRKDKSSSIACGSSRLNLAVQYVMINYVNVLCLFHNLMSKLKNLISADKLRNMTLLFYKCQNAAEQRYQSAGLSHGRTEFCEEVSQELLYINGRCTKHFRHGFLLWPETLKNIFTNA